MKRLGSFLLLVAFIVQLNCLNAFCADETLSGEIIFCNWNTDEVQSFPSNPTTFTLNSKTIITNISNYHYIDNGELPGTISIRHSDGTIYGPWQVASNNNDASANSNWNVYPNTSVKPGVYTVIDSNPKTWSYNAESNGSGFTLVEGIDDPNQESGFTEVHITTDTIANSNANNNDTNSFISLQIGSPYMKLSGQFKEIDPGRGTKAVIIEERTLLPIRAIVEAMGGLISWDPTEKKVTIVSDGNMIQMYIGKYYMTFNGVQSSIDVAPIIINERTYLPIRFVAESLNYKVSWIAETKTVNISYPTDGLDNHDGQPDADIPQDFIVVDSATPYKAVNPSVQDQTVVFEDKIKVTIPGGTLGNTEQVFIHPMPTEGIDQSLLKPLGIYDIKIGNKTQFAQKLKISIPYDASKLSANYPVESQFIAAYMNDNSPEWIYIPCQVDTTSQMITVETDHLCGFQIGYLTPEALFRYEFGTNEQIKQNFITTVNEAYNSVAGTVGGAYQKAKDGFNYIINGASDVISSVLDNVSYYYREYIDVGVGKAVNHGAIYLVGRYHIYFDVDSIKYIDDPASADYYSTTTDNSRPQDLVYGTNFFYINNGVFVEKVTPEEDQKIKIPRYIKDVANFLVNSEKRYKDNGFQPPEDDLVVIVYDSKSSGSPTYEKINKVMNIPVKSPEVNTNANLKSKIAHELFHNFQSVYFSPATMATHKWLVESTAEYASVGLVMQRKLSEARPFVFTGEDKSTYRYFDYSATATGKQHEYHSANFIEFLVNYKKITLPNLLAYCKDNVGLLTNDGDVIGNYLNSVNGTSYANNFSRIFADFIATIYLSNDSPLTGSNAYIDYNSATNKILVNKPEITQVANTVLNSTVYKPDLYGVKVEVDPKNSEGKDIEISVKSNPGQTIFAYVTNENEKLSSITPLSITTSDKATKIQQNFKENKIVYFLSISSSAIANAVTSMVGESDNCKISVVVPELIVSANEKYTFTFEVKGFENKLGCKYEWNYGDGTGETTTTRISMHTYDYKFMPGSVEATFTGKNFPVSVKVIGPDNTELAYLTDNVLIQQTIILK